MSVSFELNGRPVELDIEPRVTLADALRGPCGLTGTHLGCEHGVCGACTVHLDGLPVRSCLLFAVQCAGRTVTTVEGLGDGPGLDPVQEAFLRNRGFQCGYCTPAMVMAVAAMRNDGAPLSREEVVERLASHVCRCTGYVAIVDAACDALAQAGLLRGAAS